MLHTERQRDPEGRPNTDLALHGDRAAVTPDEFVHHCEPDSRALLGATQGAFHTMEPIEDPRELLRGNPDSGIAYVQEGAFRLPVKAHGDTPTKGELECVRQEIEDDLLPHLPIDVHRLTEIGAFHRERETGSLHRGAKGAR